MLLVSGSDKAIRKVRSIESRRILFSNNSWHGIDFNQDSFRPWAMGCNLLMRHFTGKRKRSAGVIDILFYEEPYRQYYLCVLNAPSRWHLLRLGHKKPIKEWNWVIASLFVSVWMPCIHKTLLYSLVCVIRGERALWAIRDACWVVVYRFRERREEPPASSGWYWLFIETLISKVLYEAMWKLIQQTLSAWWKGLKIHWLNQDMHCDLYKDRVQWYGSYFRLL